MGNSVAEYDTAVLDLLLEKVRRDSGYDFRDYRRGTVIRRLARRLHAAGTKTYLEYMHFLDAHPQEYPKLADDITIKVSGFFRNTYAFQQVAKLVLPALVAEKATMTERDLRFWSAACARGEEPYSIAILLDQFLGQRRCDFNVSVHASDISQSALDVAQAGIYSLDDIQGLPGNVLESYFRRQKNYEVRSEIRRMVSFSRFDLTSDTLPPFTSVDCIFCCNVLIYLQKQLQQRVLSMIYDSLATPGYLVLGEAETPTNNICDKLKCLDSKARIYKKV